MARALIILSGGIKKGQNGQWQSTGLSEEDAVWGAPGSYLRILAAKYLFDEQPNQVIVTMGGQGYDVAVKDAQQPLLYEIMKRELIFLGVAPEKIVAERKSNNTLDQVKAIGQMVAEQRFDEMLVISNRYHLPRVRVMMESNKDLADLLSKQKISLVSAEDILSEKDGKIWRDKIDRAYGSPWLKKRIAQEEKGVADWRAGRYKISSKKSWK